MIQDIYPSKLDNRFMSCEINDEDNLLVFDHDGKLYISAEEGELRFLTGAEAQSDQAIYLFSLDDRKYFFLADACDYHKEGYTYRSVRELRDVSCGKELFAAFTAYHLWKWYTDNRFCGKCGHKLGFAKEERVLKCLNCNNTVYPRINPAVIVGVIKDDCLLITRYNRGYAHNALVAGFTEIGETLEETVEREVMEETGVHVKNIRYYKSQPWGMAQDILVGFYCEAADGGTIHMDKTELKYAEWVKREDIVLQPNNLSLTNEMMRVFKENKIDGN